MAEIVTEGQYTRAFIFGWTTFLAGLMLAFAGAAGLAYFPVESYKSSTSLVLLFFGAFLWSASNAVSKRGIWHWVWSRVTDLPWTMEDIDTDEFVDGPAEVEVNDE